jgi:uncharacterized protein (DUF302 family)
VKRIIFFVIALVSLGGVGSIAAQEPATQSASPERAAVTDEATGLVTIESAYSVEETMNNLEAAIDEQGLIVVARIDHAANAEGADLELRPTQLLVFGNPELGTQLMQAEQAVGIDLPQKFLAWEAEDGTVYLGWNDPSLLAERHGLEDQDEVLDQVSMALETLAEGATAP